MSLYSVVRKFRIVQIVKLVCAKFAHTTAYQSRDGYVGGGDMRMRYNGASTSVVDRLVDALFYATEVASPKESILGASTSVVDNDANREVKIKKNLLGLGYAV